MDKKKHTAGQWFKKRFDFSDWTQEQKKTFVSFSILLTLLLITAAVISFFLVLRGNEKVLVPDVRNMEITDALIQLQERELYPRISLRFTDNPLDKNTILEQNPVPGTIVKAGRRIKLTVSKGAVLDKIENYVGQDIEAVKLHLQSLFAASRPLVTIREPVLYVFDDKPAGTILEQKPLPGTEISGPAVLDLVVSKGPETKSAEVPDFIGKTISDAVAAAETSPFVIDFSMRKAKTGEPLGVAVEQSLKAGSQSKLTERIKVVISAPEPVKGIVNGIYVYMLPEYPYPVPVKLEAIKPQGQRVTIGSFKHPGGNFSVPFSLPAGSSLILTALNKEIAKSEVPAQ